jgi:hypothetical protein
MNPKAYLSTLLFLVIITRDILSAQTLSHPWWVVDRGGGKSAAGGLKLHASIGQPAVKRMSADTLILESGFVPAVRGLGGTITTVSVAMDAGWNMTSNPVITANDSVRQLYPTSTFPYAFAYVCTTGYEQRYTMQNGVGYWEKFPSPATASITGTGITLDTIQVCAGWNMIGSLSYPLLTSHVIAVPPLTILSCFFGFSGIGYDCKDTLKPGQAYWVKVSQAGQLVLPAGSVLGPAFAQGGGSKSVLASLPDEEGVHTLTIKDAGDKERKLYFSASRTDIDREKCDLPPPPPAEILDVRFASQRALEVADTQARAQEFPIRISGAVFPITVSWDGVDDEGTYELQLTLAKEGPQHHPMSRSGGSMVIRESNFLGLTLRIRGNEPADTPKEFALHQNYPNPFNPTTTIKYDLPVGSRVSLKVYNILGQHVDAVISEVQPPGYQSAKWGNRSTAGNVVATGVYLYRLIAAPLDGGPPFVQTRKMILLR